VRQPAFLFATGAVAWAAGFLAWALLPAQPLADARDPVQIALVALPLLVALLAWASLHRTCAVGAAPHLAWLLTVIILSFSVIGAASVGLLLAPAGLLLAFSLATVEPAH
jgi:hypothetical protein